MTTKRKCDVFVSYASEDKEIARSVMHEMWKKGVTSFWIDFMNILPSNSIPEEIDKGLKAARYMISIVSANYFVKHWTKQELRAINMLEKSIIPVWCDVDARAVRKFSPILSSKRAIVWKGNASDVAGEICLVLSLDKKTDFFRAAESREECKLFWSMVWLYVLVVIGVHEDKGEMPPGWKEHIEKEITISKDKVFSLRGMLSELDDEPFAQAIVLIEKGQRAAWAPYFDGDDELMTILKKHRLWP